MAVSYALEFSLLQEVLWAVRSRHTLEHLFSKWPVHDIDHITIHWVPQDSGRENHRLSCGCAAMHSAGSATHCSHNLPWGGQTRFGERSGMRSLAIP